MQADYSENMTANKANALPLVYGYRRWLRLW
jgi:hypothetical protein